MREKQPVSGDVSNHRYDDDKDEHQIVHGECATYNYRGSTLEEEAYHGGWRPGDIPTTTQPYVQGDDPRLTRNMEVNHLYTVGMRGEPGWDDDPQFNNGDPTVTHPPAK